MKKKEKKRKRGLCATSVPQYEQKFYENYKQNYITRDV